MSRKIGKVKVKPPNELLKTSRDAMELLLKGNLDKKPEEKVRYSHVKEQSATSAVDASIDAPIYPFSVCY
jgi:hypothetical protein